MTGDNNLAASNAAAQAQQKAAATSSVLSGQTASMTAANQATAKKAILGG
jgi:hypothetical protein